MKAIETDAMVTEAGILLVRLPVDLPPGKRQVVVVIADEPQNKTKGEPLRFSDYPVSLVSDQMTFRRKDLYSGDDSSGLRGHECTRLQQYRGNNARASGTNPGYAQRPGLQAVCSPDPD